MKKATIKPNWNFRGEIDSYTVNEEETIGSEMTAGIQKGVMYATIIIVLFVCTIGFAPIWYYLTQHMIKKAETNKASPSELVLFVNKITRIPAKIILIFYVIAFVIAIISSIIGALYLLNNVDLSSIKFS